MTELQRRIIESEAAERSRNTVERYRHFDQMDLERRYDAMVSAAHSGRAPSSINAINTLYNILAIAVVAGMIFAFAWIAFTQ